MICPRLALKLLARADSSGTREALVGDLLEEVARGRSRLWVWQQVIGLYGFALAVQARRRARLTPPLVALVLSAALLGGTRIASVSSVLETWLVFYLVAGTLSLFAHMAAHIDSRGALTSGDAE